MSAARDVSRAVLVAALHPDPGAFQNLVGTAGERVDWPWVLERATAHKVAALLAARVEQGGFAPALDGAVAQRLREVRADTRRRAALAHATLDEVATAFERARIPLLVVKGSVLAEHVYQDEAMRRFFDVDIVVPPEKVGEAEALLRSLGYRLGEITKLLGRAPANEGEACIAERLTYAFYRRFEYELPFSAPRDGARLAVDLHWHIAAPTRLRVPVEALWEHSMIVEVGGRCVRTLAPDAALIHLAVHATACPFFGFRLLHLCDVAWVASRWADRLGGLASTAAAWGAEREIAVAAELLERGLGMPRFPALHTGTPGTPAPWMRLASSEAMLVQGGMGAKPGRLRRLWLETLWGLSVHYLRHNLIRSLRVRLSRVQWWYQRRVVGPRGGDR